MYALLYSKPMDQFKSAISNIFVVAKFGEGCDLLSKYLILHGELPIINNVFKYIHHLIWDSFDNNYIKILIPIMVDKKMNASIQNYV